MLQVYYSNLNNNYCIEKQGLKCDLCSSELHKAFILDYVFSRKKRAQMRVYCLKCCKHTAPLGEVIERKIVFIYPLLPEDATIVPPIKPDLANSSNLSTFEIAHRQVASEKTIDKTKHAGRQSFEGAQIGSPDVSLLVQKEQMVDDELFETITHALPEGYNLLEHEPTKRGALERLDKKVSKIK